MSGLSPSRFKRVSVDSTLSRDTKTSMLAETQQLTDALARLCQDQVRQAGQRYTPGVDSKAPNIRIASLVAAIENLACGPTARRRFHAFLSELRTNWERAKAFSQQPGLIDAHINSADEALETLLPRLRASDQAAAQDWVARLAELATALQADVAHLQTDLSKLPQSAEQTAQESQRDLIRGRISAINSCLQVLNAEREYCETAAFKLLSSPLLLLTGEWGTGKTHLLCDVTQERIRDSRTTILVLAKNFQNAPLSNICALIDAGATPEAIFDRLRGSAKELGERAVVIVDGVNEGRRVPWRRAISALRLLAKERPDIGLIVSCRSPFERAALAPDDLSAFHQLAHNGFDDQQFDAQTAFFHYYELPLPEVPLLDREFSRPLTLKLICQSLRNLTAKKFAKGFAGIASGQRGMTYVLESFVTRVGDVVEREFGLQPKACWWLLKGSNRIAKRDEAGFAPCMAAKLRAYVRPTEARRIISAAYPQMKRARTRALLEALRTNGLLDEDVVWYRSNAEIKPRVVFRLPYQRFSDHLIARHLLESYLDVSSEDAIKGSFTGNSPLARIFSATKRRRSYAEPAWAQALITEFPERVRKQLPSKRRELFFALPARAQDLSAYFEPFVEGLFWRAPTAFTEGTRRVLNEYLSADGHTWERVIDALAAISTKPKHPYHARRLFEYLSRFPMPDRDAMWSEYLRRDYASPTIQRLLAWARTFNAAKMSEAAAEQLVILLSLVLTTVVRSDRDTATKGLVVIGESHPGVLFEHALTSLTFNDPYVSERMLGAAYGVTMSLVDSEAATGFRPLLGRLARDLYGAMFAPQSRYATHHTLKKDYALGVIELAQRANCVALPRNAAHYLNTPHSQIPSTFASDGTPDPAVTESIGHAIQMDFGNYTLGRLIPGRANYDNDNPEYVRVRAKIERRIHDLGYTSERFQAIDAQIGRSSFQARDKDKVDRYGKKYAWIAYFEMWGERENARSLPDWRLGERTSDCDIDPSFPRYPPAWNPPLPDLFGDTQTDASAWVKGGHTPKWDSLLFVPEINGLTGPWVLLEGFVRGENQTLDRELFAFLRGLFVAKRDIRRLRARFRMVDYPGNSRIPEGASEHYLFAGEAGRRPRYARHLRSSNGAYRRQLGESFERYVPIASRRTSDSRTIEIRFVSAAGEDVVESFKSQPTQRTRRIRGIPVELPSITFGWESYHSKQNSFSGFYLPAPSLIQKLAVSTRNRQVDFYDEHGVPAFIYREAGEEWKGDRHNLLYLRSDLLQRYLTRTRQKLVWCNWGERNWLDKMDGLHLRNDPAKQAILQNHQHIHRSFHQYTE